jgi:undecaprenyl diphosphate synthase
MRKTPKAKLQQGPMHVAIIPDGNRRWSRTHRLNLINGYSTGIKKIVDICIWAKKRGVKTMSVWALSTENAQNRSKQELRILYNLYIKACKDKHILKILKDNQARIKVIGNMSLLPSKLNEAFRGLERQTRMYKEITINLLVGYGGRDDIKYAVENLYAGGRRPGKIDYDTIRSRLRTASIPDIDLIIRTSGEMRLSGLLPWQSNYSELYFAKKYWPDFGEQDLKRAISTYKRRQRRFGR